MDGPADGGKDSLIYPSLQLESALLIDMGIVNPNSLVVLTLLLVRVSSGVL